MPSQITIQNYEEFFLLYVDNELSAAERETVDEFVRLHPHLAEELEMLQQVQLLDEPLLFGDKESLYRKESEDITLANCEEQFLLFVDDELSPEAKEKVETFVLQHPAVQEGFTLLKQTRLEAETIVFPGKSSLYRKEEKERPVFYLRWQRIAVAAAIIGLAVAVWSVLPGDQTTGSAPQQNIAQAGAKNNAGAATRNAGIDPSANKENNNGTALVENGQSPSSQTATNNVVLKQNNGVAVVAPNTNNNTAVAIEQPAGANNSLLAAADLPKATEIRGETVSTDNHNSFQTAVTSTQRVNTDHAALENHAGTASSTDAVSGGPNNNEAQPAVYRELDTEDEKKSLLLGSLEINKDKLRGFFRKAGSIFRSKSKTEDEKTESRPSSNTRAIR
ncbi:hypothetical protein GWC95_00995 [Sediminibacterium roseum]|uniref:Uncharacterized protein n=1 Tax=Sediminibacterium roseum TaxID=1978412 RepID=A0ABW9ZR09_9BACT|nr:hypothetical protein [Sediminibacterium roseum]NCI48478.1 hypothetical protein [Sediminibacterium roseum]